MQTLCFTSSQLRLALLIERLTTFFFINLWFCSVVVAIKERKEKRDGPLLDACFVDLEYTYRVATVAAVSGRLDGGAPTGVVAEAMGMSIECRSRRAGS